MTTRTLPTRKPITDAAAAEPFAPDLDGDALPGKTLTLPFTIVCDTREQNPWQFTGHPSRDGDRLLVAVVKRQALTVGDYAVRTGNGELLPLRIERKSQADLFGTLGKGRNRFSRECERARDAGLQLHIVVEDRWPDVLTPPPEVSRVTGKVIAGTVASWSLRFDAHWWFPGGRLAAERWALRLMEHSYRQHAERP